MNKAEKEALLDFIDAQADRICNKMKSLSDNEIIRDQAYWAERGISYRIDESRDAFLEAGDESDTATN